jgi:hypothetical protein
MKYIIHATVSLWGRLLVCFFCINPLFAQIQTSNNSTNKERFNSVLTHFRNTKDTLRYQAACFLINNMQGHDTYNYYWADSLNKKIEFDELAYSDLSSSIAAFDSLKTKIGKVHPVATINNDLELVTPDFLIQHIEQAFQAWQPSQYDFKTFCEYILPYRVSVEPLQDWQEKYKTTYTQVVDNQLNKIKNNLASNLKKLADYNNKWFLCTYKIETRSEPLPRLGALQLLHRKKGTCEDAAALTTFALRSIGLPSTTDIVPYWATSTGGHTLNSTFDTNGKAIHFDVLSMDSLKEFVREPAKVFRATFSAQANALASQISQDEIPAGMLRSKCYVDVTQEYWQTRDLQCKIYTPQAENKIIYACVFNGGKFRPAWWGKARKDSVTFTNVCKGAIFLPKIYEKEKWITVGYPVVSGYNKVVELKPSNETHTISIKEQAKYLKFRVGKKYRLSYYDKDGWKEIATKTAEETTTEFIFENVPKNSLLWLVPSYSEGKERPFVITDEGERLWW